MNRVTLNGHWSTRLVGTTRQLGVKVLAIGLFFQSIKLVSLGGYLQNPFTRYLEIVDDSAKYRTGNLYEFNYFFFP